MEKKQVSTHETLSKRSIKVTNEIDTAEYSLPAWFPSTEAFYALPVLSQHGVAKAVVDFRAKCREHMTGKITQEELNTWELKAFEVPKTKAAPLPVTLDGFIALMKQQFGMSEAEILAKLTKQA